MASDPRIQLLIHVGTQEEVIDSVVAAGVDTATRYYRNGRPGRGAYELARLAIRLNRLLDQTGVPA